jgi:type IV pilus assembly protein PilQ
MIRLLLSLLLVHASLFSIISCTTSNSGSDDLTEESGPIEEDGLNDTAGADTGEDEFAEPGDVAANEETPSSEAGTEDDLDAELDAEPGETAEEAPPAEDKATAQNDQELEALDGDLGENDLEETPVAKEPSVDSTPVPPEPEPAPAPEAPEKAKVRNIRYLANSSGGTVVIETSKPVQYQTRMNAATNQFVIELADVELPPALQRPYPMSDFKSRIGSINAYQTAGSNTARVVVQLKGASQGEPIVQQEGTSLVMIPPAAAPLAVIQKPSKVQPPAAKGKPSAGALAARTLDEFLTGNQKFYGRNISLQVKDADVRDVVNFLAEESGANIVMSDDVNGKISLKLRRVPWDQALVTVMRSKNLGYVRQGNVLRISSLAALQKETEAANKILEAQKAIVPSIVQVIPISYADLEELQKNVKAFLSKDGQVVIDKRSSTVVVTEKADVVERVQKLIKTLDIPPMQVLIESKIVEAVEEFRRLVGINWGFGGQEVSLSPTGGANGGQLSMTLNNQIQNVPKNASTNMLAGMQIGTLDIFGTLDAALALAEHDSLAKVISSPRISAMNREKALIKQEGENVTIVTTRSETTGATTATEKRTPFSLELGVTPQITADGGVIMDLEVKREFLGAEVDPTTKARPVSKRSAKTKVMVRNGQTTVIGGIYTSDELEATDGVPGLKDIPILGWLFKSKQFNRTKNELLIFLTPRILSDQPTDLASAAPAAEPKDSELQ